MIFMKLNERYFEYIKSGTKRIELRLNDEKRKSIKIGDKIRFLKLPKLDEYIDVTVEDLIKYNNFNEIINKYPIEILACKRMNKKELLKDLEEFYSKEKQEKYGILGIKFSI